MKQIKLPSVKADPVALGGGMNTVVSPMFAKPGTALLAYNYEYAVDGGMERIRGIEPFDGRPVPSAAVYVYLECDADVSAAIALGDTVEGATSGATGVVIYINATFIAVTRVTGVFVAEDLEVSAVVVATVADAEPEVDGFLDNRLSKYAADNYQADITKVPGSGRIRGLAILNDVVYAWRDNAGATAMAIYKSTTGGWVSALGAYELLTFTAGSSEYTEGETITQGAATATVKRVMLESGTWGAGTAAGRMVIGARAGGNFGAGASAGDGAATLSGIQTAITLAAGGATGRVRTDAFTFTAAHAKRLYGCDGVNPEFEFDGDILVPINVGDTGGVRATFVRCHKNHLFYGFRGSLLNSAIGNPYVWTAVFGAAELATGDIITNLISIGGNEAGAALFTTCENALFVLYGSSAADFKLVPLSRISGAASDSAQDIGGIVALDNPGIMRYPQSQDFGNFAWDTVSLQIQNLVRAQGCACSVFVSGYFKYRLFLADGSAVSGLPNGRKNFDWSVIDYNRAILLAEHAEIDGSPRTFYADGDGWVYEADVGRSFAGETIEYAARLHPLSQRSPMIEKSYLQGEFELAAQSAFTLRTAAEFENNDEEGQTQVQQTRQYGPGALWDITNYDQSYYDVSAVSRRAFPLEGQGTGVTLMFGGEADDELSHVLYGLVSTYIPRKLKP